MRKVEREKINSALSDLDETKDRYDFLDWGEETDEAFVERTVADVSDILSACERVLRTIGLVEDGLRKEMVKQIKERHEQIAAKIVEEELWTLVSKKPNKEEK